MERRAEAGEQQLPAQRGQERPGDEGGRGGGAEHGCVPADNQCREVQHRKRIEQRQPDKAEISPAGARGRSQRQPRSCRREQAMPPADRAPRAPPAPRHQSAVAAQQPARAAGPGRSRCWRPLRRRPGPRSLHPRRRRRRPGTKCGQPARRLAQRSHPAARRCRSRPPARPARRASPVGPRSEAGALSEQHNHIDRRRCIHVRQYIDNCQSIPASAPVAGGPGYHATRMPLSPRADQPGGARTSSWR